MRWEKNNKNGLQKQKFLLNYAQGKSERAKVARRKQELDHFQATLELFECGEIPVARL